MDSVFESDPKLDRVRSGPLDPGSGPSIYISSGSGLSWSPGPTQTQPTYIPIRAIMTMLMILDEQELVS